MRPTIPVRALRGRDPVTVEIEVNALSAKPLGQIAPENVADLCALSELGDLPTGIRVRLKGFAERIARAIGDLPNGGGLTDYAAALGELPAERVPASLRAAFAVEIENPKRTDRDRAAISDLLAAWEGVEPEIFVMGVAKPSRPLPAAPPREERVRTGSARPARERPPVAPRVARAAAERDPERVAWIRQIVMERLAGAVDQGLLETVIVAGARHRARDRYPDLTAQEIVAVLRELEASGRVRHAVTRWRLPTRF